MVYSQSAGKIRK